MSIEIERKFLLKNDAWRATASPGQPCVQAYLAFGPPVSVRVRIMGGKARLNIKESVLNIRRAEFEYEIPVADAQALIDTHTDGRIVAKTRYIVRHGEHDWEVDVFEQANAGLVVAEIELGATDEEFGCPDWLGEEVSGDARYLNSSLAQSPWRRWPENAAD